MSFLTLLPLRVPAPLPSPSSSTSAASQGGADLTPLRRYGVDCDRLVELRDRCRSLLWAIVERDEPGAAAAAAAAAGSGGDDNNIDDSALLACLQEYQSALQECIERRVPSNHLAFGWRWSSSMKSKSRRNGTAPVTTGEDSTGLESFVWGRGLEWERRNVVVNVLVLQVRQASAILGGLAAASPSTADASSSNKKTNVSLLQRGIVALQNAATLAHHLADAHGDSDDEDEEGGSTSTRPDSQGDLSEPYLGWLEQYLLGEAQRHVVAMFEALKRQPALLAKMSAACTPLYQEAVNRANRFDAHNNNNGGAIWPDQEVCVDVTRAWGMYFDSASEYHQAIAHCDKKEWEAAATRLVAALRYNTLCVDFCDSSSDASPIVSTEVRDQTEALLRSIQEKLRVLQVQQVATLDHEDLPEIQPQSQAKLIPDCVSKLLPTIEFDPPLLQTPPSSPTPPIEEELDYARSSSRSLSRVDEGEDDDGEPSVPGTATPTRTSPNPRQTASLSPNARRADSPPSSGRHQHQHSQAPQSPPYSSHSPPVQQHRSNPQATASASSPPTRRSYSPPTPEQVLDWREQQHAMVDDLAQRVANKADEARRALSLVGLPHSVAAYRQRHGGGGIPLDLWRRVEEVQQTQRDEALKSQLWQLRDDSDKAQHIFRSIQGQLEEDLALDRMFREQYGDDFVGHNVHEVQVHFRRVLDDYSRLMASAQESDRVLAEKLQILETDPKFRLLKFRKEQLDHLLPSSRSRRRSGDASEGQHDDEGDEPEPIDVSELSECLVTLSELIDQRDAQVGALQDFIDRVTADLQGVDDEDEDEEEEDEEQSNPEDRNGGEGFGRGHGGGGLVVVAGGERTMEAANRHIRDQVMLVQRSLQEQNTLIRHILVLNEAFLVAQRDAVESGVASAAVATSAVAMESSTNILEKLGDALEELDQFTSHLQEGTAFYKVIIPKLEKLQHNVGDVSARLAVERYEFDDRIRRSRQEEEDARVAERMSSNPHQHHPGSTSSSASLGSGSGGHGGSDAGGGGRYAVTGSGGAVAPSPMYAPAPIPVPQPQPQPPPPRVEQYSHADGPPVRVDDSKVASLIELGFDPDRVVSALRRYNNDMDQAINDLLG